MVITKEIKNYSLNYYGLGKQYTQKKFRAMIWLYENESQAAAMFYFYNQTTAIPDTDELTEDGFIMAHYSADDFPKIIDLLRNEKPIYLHYVEADKRGFISTSLEPVGEDEFK